MMVGKLEVEAMKSEEWYVRDRRGNLVIGPLFVGYIHKIMHKKEIVQNCDVSQKGEFWEPIHQVPQLVPNHLLNLIENK